MNKNIKKIVAIALTVTAFSSVVPVANLDFINAKVYASSGDLTSIRVKNSDGDTIKTYSEDSYKSRYEVDYNELNDNETYYAKTSSNKITISTRGVSSSRVRIFKSRSSSARGIKPGNTIELTSGSTTTLTIRTYNDDPGTARYDDSYESQYIIKVKCTGTSSETSTEDNGDVYLETLRLSEGELNFSKNTSTYNVNVNESVSELKITAKPDCDSDEYDDYDVKINGVTINESDDFKRTVSLLNKGKNEFKITVENDDHEKRTYTLNIYRGQTDVNNGVTDKTNQWVMVNGKWQYIDSIGNPVKNTWFYDRTLGKNYYLQPDGNMATGWIIYDGSWYYLGNDGAKKTGWQLYNGTWYYLDFEGKMKTGWIMDVDGRYYYLYSNGAMAYSTTIGGYRLGSNGAWIR
ncbi:cadherin-like beta sandwich domain-containing protein [Clostridium sp. C2-6-12]|uniref:N-acetylmuramoyl-L-alanine amidase family protein n=1 Tax=Clostridium sp. C2-6-12 TaxID=2698832 RepID=UPI001370EDA8|nr:cadherin-like beta sandwich domain-containing protein [Clostridium sp. C2-6-12]